MSRNSPLQHSNVPWREWLKTVTAARVLPDGQKELAQAQDIAPNLSPGLHVADLSHLAPPVDLRAALASARGVALAAANFVGFQIMAPADGNGIWITGWNVQQGGATVSDMYMNLGTTAFQNVADATIEGQLGTAPAVAVPRVGTGNAVGSDAWSIGTSGGGQGFTLGILLPGGKPLYLPRGETIELIANISGATTISRGFLTWQEIP